MLLDGIEADSSLVLCQPVGPLVRAIDEVPLWQKPGIVGRFPFIGPTLNVVYNWKRQKLTYKSVGEFLSDSLGPGEDMTGKRVGILERTADSPSVLRETNDALVAKGPSE